MLVKTDTAKLHMLMKLLLFFVCGVTGRAIFIYI